MLLAEVLDEVRDGHLSGDIANRLWEQMGRSTTRFGAWTAIPPTAPWSARSPNSTPRQGLREVGQLLLDSGAWKGQPLLDKDFVTR